MPQKDTIKDTKDEMSYITEKEHEQRALFVDYLSKKAQRVSSASYLVTQHLKDGELLKTHIRQAALNVLNNVFYIKKTFSREHVDVFNAQLSTLLSFLYMGHDIGLIRENNVHVLAHEIRGIIEESQEALGNDSKTPISNSFFAISAPEKHANHKGTSSQKTRAVGDTEVRTPGKQSAHRKARLERIVSTLSNKGRASVKDIAENISGVSEKTIQRDLQVLIDAGRVHKKGKRRWSTYELTT